MEYETIAEDVAQIENNDPAAITDENPNDPRVFY